MQSIYVWVGKNKLSVYRKSDFGRHYLDGEPEFAYKIGNYKEDLKEFLELLRDSFNMSEEEQFEISLITNTQKMYSDKVSKVLGMDIVETYDIYKILKESILRLSKDKKMMILEYGINYEEKNYILEKNGIEEREFSLLGYPITTDDLMEVLK